MPRYDFVSPGGMANDALTEFFVKREMEKIEALKREAQAQQQQATIRQRDEELGLRRADQEADAAKVRAQTERQAAQDAQAASTARNQAGVRDMVATRMGQGPLNPQDASSIIGMLYREDMPVPGVVDAAMQPPKEAAGFTLGQDQVRFDAQGNPIARGPRSPAPAGKGGSSAAGDYTARGQSRLLRALDDLEPMVGPATVGTWRARGMRAEPFAPGSVDPTVDFDKALEQIGALIGFSELNAMRQASPTGGALGQVSERELTYLQSVLGSLDPNQSEEAFRRQLQKIRGEIQRVVDHGLDAAGGGAPAGGAGGSVRMRAPDGRMLTVPAAQVEAAKARGATVVQ